METALYEKHIKGGHVTREHKGLSPTRVQSGSEVTMREKSETENKGNILQGPDCNEARWGERVQSGDTGNGIARLR